MSVGSEAPYGVRRGQTYFDGRTPDATEGLSLEGLEGEFNDPNLATAGVKGPRTNQKVYAKLMRNVSGGALLPKRVVKCYLSGSSNEILGQFDGYATTPGTDVIAGVLDEWLPAAGCPDDDICWVVFRGPSKVTSAAAGDTTIGIGNRVVPAADGKVVDQDVTVAAGSATFAQIHGEVGKAITAVAAINTDFLLDVDISK